MENLSMIDWSFLGEDRDEFVLDLSRSSLIECMDAYAEHKGKTHPSVEGRMRALKGHIRRLEFIAHTTIRTNQVTSIFYARFIDMFVLGCNLGQRHSDLVRIERACFSEGRMTILQQKTKNKANVNLQDLTIDRKTTFRILEKYNYEAPYKGDICNYNKHIRQLAKIVFGDETFSQQKIVENDARIVEVPKYRMISSHTARRTFATYNYLVRKFPAVDVMRATGHTSEKSFQKYICGQED